MTSFNWCAFSGVDLMMVGMVKGWRQNTIAGP
jgi:hypothetical protein